MYAQKRPGQENQSGQENDAYIESYVMKQTNGQSIPECLLYHLKVQHGYPNSKDQSH